MPGNHSGDSVAGNSRTGRFPQEARLLRHADFERVYKQGRRHFSATMTVFYFLRPEPGAAAELSEGQRAGVPVPHELAQHRALPRGLRVGFTVGRVLGGAVDRNRMKRRLREAVRMTRPLNGAGADVVINPKKAILAADFVNVVNEVKRAFAVIEQKLGAPRPTVKSSGNESRS